MMFLLFEAVKQAREKGLSICQLQLFNNCKREIPFYFSIIDSLEWWH